MVDNPITHVLKNGSPAQVEQLKQMGRDAVDWVKLLIKKMGVENATKLVLKRIDKEADRLNVNNDS